MYLKPESPLPIGGVLDNGFSLYRHSIRETFGFALASAFLTALINRVLTGALGPGGEMDLGLAAAGVVLSLAVSILLFTPIVARMHAIQNGERLPAPAALRLGVARFFPVLATAVLYVLMLTVGMALLIVPGIYVMVAFLFSMIVVITEGRGVIEALRYSHELVRGRWWRTLVLLTIASIVASLLYILIAFVFSMIVGLRGAEAIAAGEIQMPWWLELVAMPILSGFLMPLFYALLLAMYAEAKLRHEGADIAERIAAAEA